MKVALILGVLLILAVNGAAVPPATEPFRPYLTDATLALSVLVLIGLLLPARQKTSPSETQAEPARASPPTSAAVRTDRFDPGQLGEVDDSFALRATTAMPAWGCASACFDGDATGPRSRAAACLRHDHRARKSSLSLIAVTRSTGVAPARRGSHDRV